MRCRLLQRLGLATVFRTFIAASYTEFPTRGPEPRADAGLTPHQGTLIRHQPRPTPCAAHCARLALAAAAAVWAACAACAAAADEAVGPPAATADAQQVVVTGTPLPGTARDIDKIPANVAVLSSEDLTRQGPASLTQALNANLGSISINDDLDDPFQPDILYRGFEASPVLGTPQGLAVYQNGVRINEAFGDTVNWDLFPDAAISQVELVSSSPLYGLNALGGAISVTMKNGFNYQDAALELTGGSYGNRSAVGQFGTSSGAFGFYIAGRALDADGWREFSNDRIRSLYAVASLHTDRVTLDLSDTHADNALQGQGSAPVQELAVSRSLVFTGPQNNINTLNFLALNANLRLADRWSLQGVAYYRDYGQSVANGNTTDYVACQATPGILCQPDGVTPLTNAAGAQLPDISQGGSVPIGENDFETVHAFGRGLTLQLSSDASLLGHGNRLSLGAAVDYAASSFYTAAELGVINSQLLVQPSGLIVYTPENSPAAIVNGDPTPVSVDSVNKNVGAYLTDALDVTPDLTVTASGRYNIAHIELADQLGANLTGASRFVHFNPAVGATYHLLPSATLYGGLAINTRTPTASEIECSDPLTPCLLPTNLAGDPPDLRQVISHTAEAGVRGKGSDSTLGGEWTWNLSVFRTLLHDDIYGIATSVSQGFFQNIGDTRRQGVEAGLHYRDRRWSAFLSYSLVEATFRSPLLVPSPSNPLQDAQGDIQVEPGDRLPGIPEHRLKAGLEYALTPAWSLGTSVEWRSSVYYVGDEANLLAPIPGYAVVHLHSTYRPSTHVELFASVDNLFDRKYATWGILSDPTGIGAPGIPAGAVTNGPGVDNRFLSAAAPLEAFLGVRLTL
jgi:iron complex outermembrane recepter protein